MATSKALKAGKAGIHEIEDSVRQESIQPVTTNVAKAVEYADKDVAGMPRRFKDPNRYCHKQKLIWKVNKRILVVMLGTYFC